MYSITLMDFSYAMHWLGLGETRRRVLMNLHQPLTAKQLARRDSIDRDTCSATLADLTLYELVRCLNPEARRSRLYWLTRLGLRCQRAIRKECGLEPLQHNLPLVDWPLYGWICFSHRGSIVKALTGTMQPSEIKRRAKLDDPSLRMSANNVRDAIYLLLAKGIVMPIRVRGQNHHRYQLTETGRILRELLIAA